MVTNDETTIDPVLGIMRFTDEDAVTAVQLAIGAASMCWENVSNAGVFESETAAQIASDLVDHLRRLRLMPERPSDVDAA